VPGWLGPDDWPPMPSIGRVSAKFGSEGPRVAQARVSDIKRGRVGSFSLDLLVRLAAGAGLNPRLKLVAQ
jgi:hypothetical protein